MDSVFTFRFPLLRAMSWAGQLPILAILIGGVPLFFVRPRSDYFSILAGMSILYLGLIAVATLGLRAFRFSVSTRGIRGWTELSVRSSTVPWASITEVRRALYADIPCISIKTDISKKACLIPVAVAQLPEFYNAVTQLAGPRCLIEALQSVA